MTAATLAAFALASTAVVVVPGPNLVYIFMCGVSHGKRAGLVSALGVETATLIYVGATAFGVSALIVRSDVAFASLRYAGAAYLIYLAVRTLRHPPGVDVGRAAVPLGMGRIYRDGAIVNLLNPKVALFFLAFLPHFVTPDSSAESVRAQLLVLGGVFLLIAFVLDVTYALASGAAGTWLRQRSGRLAWTRWPVIAVYLALAVYASLA